MKFLNAWMHKKKSFLSVEITGILKKNQYLDTMQNTLLTAITRYAFYYFFYPSFSNVPFSDT